MALPGEPDTVSSLPPATTARVPAAPARAALATEGDARFDGIEGLRAIAALAVFLTHVSLVRSADVAPPPGFDRIVGAIFDEGNIGVSIFFAISGFVLYRPFAVAHLGGPKAPRIRGYAIRRAVRIYPAYWVALAGCVLVIRDTTYLHGASRWAWNVALLQQYSYDARFSTQGPSGLPLLEGMPQAWTLVVEVTFYAFLPLFALGVGLAARADRADRAWRSEWAAIGLLVVLGTAALVWSLRPAWEGGAPMWVRVLPVQLPLFACGMALAVLSARAATGGGFPRAVTAAGRHPGRCWLVGVAAYGGVVMMNVTHTLPAQLEDWRWLGRVGLHAIAATALLVPAVVGGEGRDRVRSFLRHPVMIFVGSISYGIYLWHLATLQWVGDHLVGDTWNLSVVTVVLIVVGLPITMAFAWLSWRVVESPAMGLGRRLSARRARPTQ